MKAIYRGFELEVKRRSGWVYYTAYRISDGYELICDYSTGADSLKTYIECLKTQVDDYYNHPENWEGSK